MGVNKKVTVGWREWVALPALQIPAIKAKIDTGARTSALHAFDLEPVEANGEQMVRFAVHPLQRRQDVTVTCVARVVDRRTVTNSGGQSEERYVIETPIRIGAAEWLIEVTLTNRKEMKFRMLLGRTAMRKRILVNPGRSYQMGRPSARRYTSRPPAGQ